MWKRGWEELGLELGLKLTRRSANAITIRVLLLIDADLAVNHGHDLVPEGSKFCVTQLVEACDTRVFIHTLMGLSALPTVTVSW